MHAQRNFFHKQRFFYCCLWFPSEHFPDLPNIMAGNKVSVTNTELNIVPFPMAEQVDIFHLRTDWLEIFAPVPRGKTSPPDRPRIKLFHLQAGYISPTPYRWLHNKENHKGYNPYNHYFTNDDLFSHLPVKSSG